MTKYVFNDVVSLKGNIDKSVKRIPVEKLWGKDLKKLSKFPLHVFAEVYNLLDFSNSDGRSYLGVADYGDSVGSMIVHLYNTKDDFFIDVIDGAKDLVSIEDKAVIKDDFNEYSCRYSSLSLEDKADLTNRLKNTLSYCKNNNVSDVYVVFPAGFEEHRLPPLCEYLVKNSNSTMSDYLNSGECRKDFDFLLLDDVQDPQEIEEFMSDELSEMRDNMEAFASKYTSEGTYVEHEVGSYCLLLNYFYHYTVMSPISE